MDLTTLTQAKRQLLIDAAAAGFAVEHGEFCVDVVKRTRHARPRIAVALRLYATGTAFDATMDLAAAKAIRNAADMRAFLKLD